MGGDKGDRGGAGGGVMHDPALKIQDNLVYARVETLHDVQHAASTMYTPAASS